MTSTTTFDALPSRTPLARRRTSRRVDPYWGSLWRAGSTESWWSREDAARLVRSGAMSSVPAHLRVRPSEGWKRMDTTRGRETAMRVLACLDMWRTMTAEQVEAMTGLTGIDFGSQRPWLSTLWGVDLVEFAVIANALSVGWKDTPARLMRPARVGPATRRFEESLTWSEWVSVTSGYGIQPDRQFDRHNVLASELGLRAAEFANVGAVLGEKLSTLDLLAYSSWGRVSPEPAGSAADLTLVRPDGARIAVEVTASKVGGWIQEKVDRHARTLQRNTMDESGLAVVFVVAPHQDAPASEVTATLNTLKKAIARAVRAYPGTHGSPTAERIGVASWAHWFPGPHEVAGDFPRLPVERPTARGYLMGDDEERLWEPAWLLDENSLPFHPLDRAAATAVLRNADGLRGVPRFLTEQRERPLLHELSVANAGFATVPVVEGASTNAGEPHPRLKY